MEEMKPKTLMEMLWQFQGKVVLSSVEKEMLHTIIRCAQSESQHKERPVVLIGKD